MGSIVEEFKNKNRTVYEKSIGELDKAMYDQFIELKARYNNVNVKKIDNKLIEQMKKELLDFIDNFEEENKTYMNHITLKLMERLRSTIESWEIEEHNHQSVQYKEKTEIHIQHHQNLNQVEPEEALSKIEIERLQKRRLRKNKFKGYQKFKKYPSISRFSAIKGTINHF